MNLEGVVFERVLINLDAQIRQTGAVVTRGTLPVIFNDDDHMAQIFQNLIGNSIKCQRQNIAAYSRRAPGPKMTNKACFCVSDIIKV